MLIENDIFESKLIDIFTSINTAYIESYDVTIFIVINAWFKSQYMLVHTLKTTTVFFEIECVLRIHNITLPKRDYLFESTTSANFFVYAHVINSNTKFPLIRNEINFFVTISRYFPLKTLNEMNYFNFYLINANNSNFAIRFLKANHKTIWFKKVFISYTTVVINKRSTICKTKLFINIIIYEVSITVMKIFTDLINGYLKLWIDQKFVKLFGKNWMRISLKTDWKKSIKKKSKFIF